MPDKGWLAVIAVLAGLGAFFLVVVAGIAAWIGGIVISDKIKNRPKKHITIEELKIKWADVPVEKR